MGPKCGKDHPCTFTCGAAVTATLNSVKEGKFTVVASKDSQGRPNPRWCLNYQTTQNNAVGLSFGCTVDDTANKACHSACQRCAERQKSCVGRWEHKPCGPAMNQTPCPEEPSP